MKDTYTSHNARDFRQRYVGTFGRYKRSDGTYITVSIDEISDQEVYFKDPNGVSLSARVDAGVEFEFYPLERRLTDYNGQVIYSARRPERQWSRGVCDGNTLIVNLSKSTAAIRVDHKIVDAIYNSEQNYRQTYADFLKGARSSFLLSSRFAVVGSRLYLYNKSFGTYSDKTITVDPLFAQEVKDALARSGITDVKLVISEETKDTKKVAIPEGYEDDDF